MKVKIWKGDMTLAERRYGGGGVGIKDFALELVRCVSPQGTK